MFAPSVVVKSNSPAPPTPAPTVTGGNTPQVKGTYIMLGLDKNLDKKINRILRTK